MIQKKNVEELKQNGILNHNNFFCVYVELTQDNPITKPRSIVFDPTYIKKTLEYALDREQVQPILL